jgi:hypothetical protein
MKKILLLLTVLLVITGSCSKKPSDYYSIVPQIYYKSVTPNTINERDTTSAVQIQFEFTDGDGDLGYDQQDTVHNIYFKDSRDTAAADFTFNYPFPYVASNMRPKNGSLQGNVVANLTYSYFSINLDSLHVALGGDTLTFKIYIIDKAGHKSNVITTDPIYVKL